MTSRALSISAWVFVSLAVAVFLMEGISSQGFWEDPVPSTGPLPRLVPRQGAEPDVSETARVLQLEEAASTRWPPLTQWILRGFVRLGRLEITARIPSLVSMGLLALLLVLFLRHRGENPAEPLLGLLALGSTPAFLVTARTLNLEFLTVLFHSAFVVAAHAWLEAKSGDRRRHWVGAGALGALAGAVLSGGWFWGAAVTPAALLGALAFSHAGSRRERIVLGIWVLLALALVPLLARPGVPEWLRIHSNPASSVPSVKAPHAIFMAYPVRVFFSTFPWSLLALLGFLTAAGKSPSGAVKKQEAGVQEAPGAVSLSFLAGWLVVVLFAGAYWEMRVENAMFLGIFPLCASGAVFLARHGRVLLHPAPALLLALGGLLVLRDFATYPQILPEFFTTAEIPSVRLRLGIGILPLAAALVAPLVWMGIGALHSFPVFWTAFWTDSRRVSPVFRVLTLLPHLVGRGIAFLWGHRPGRGLLLARLKALAPFASRAAGVAPQLFLLALLSYGGWFSLHVIPGLVREFSSRPALAAVAAHASSTDGLGVHEISPRTAPLYAGRPAAVIASETEIAAWMNASARNFLVFPVQLLGKMDYLARTRGFPYHLMPTDSLSLRVAVNRLPAGVPDANPLLRWVFSEPPPSTYKIQSSLENALELVGYDTPRKVARGERMTVRLVFRVERSLPAENQVFIHLDPPYGTRITADHEPVRGLLPTRYFAPGTYVVDEYTFSIPRMGFPVGRYGLFVGLFSGNNRVKVVSGAHAGQNRIPLGFVDVLPASFPFSCH